MCPIIWVKRHQDRLVLGARCTREFKMSIAQYLKALEAAEHHAQYVRRPFTILEGGAASSDELTHPPLYVLERCVCCNVPFE